MEVTWKDWIVMKDLHTHSAALYVTSSGLRFKMKESDLGLLRLQLFANDSPTTPAYCSVNMRYNRVHGIFVSVVQLHESEITTAAVLDIFINEYQEFWITWHNGHIHMGGDYDYKPFLSLQLQPYEEMIKYVKFQKDPYPFHNDLEVIINASPVDLKNPKYKILENSDLRWERVENNILPLDAIVGGLENEPVYIARAHHNGSLCPGKYIRWQGKAFVPWGGTEHEKIEFEVLCGYDYQWVKSKGHFIPENVFVAGRSEVRNEPLYVARAYHRGYLIPGKVHAIYGTCYLPYSGQEVEVGSYEILVRPSVTPHGQLPEYNKSSSEDEL